MIWIAGLVLLALLVFVPRFRKVLAGFLLFVLCAGAFFYLLGRHQEQDSLTRIASTDVSLEDLAFTPSENLYRLTGRLVNHSTQHTLRELGLLVTVNDCSRETQACITIGEARENLYLRIPPKQARDFKEAIHFPDGTPRPKGDMQWSYSIVEIKAE